VDWLKGYYEPGVVFPLSLKLLVVVGLASWQHRGRKLVLSLLVLLSAQYILWRGLFTLNTDTPSAVVLSGLVYLAEFYNFVQVLFFAYQTWSPRERMSPPLRECPTVDIMVPIVDEPLYILRRTLVGCLAQDYPHDRFAVYVLDDGQREDVRELAEAMGCRYLRRPTHEHAKAGNLNHALIHSTGVIIAVFDVDHVPVQSFLRDTVPFFQDEKMAIVQTPHHFYNRDIFQRNLRLDPVFKDEQALFFQVLEAGRDTHNSTFFAGSCGLFRRSALDAIGGFQTETITEDLHTSILIHAKGYRSCHLNKILASGLMPEDFTGYLKQRARWAMGAIQVLVRANPLTTPGLTLAQRVDYFASLYYFLFGLARVVCLAAPLAWLFFGVPVLKADTLTLMSLFFCHYFAGTLAISVISRGTRSAFWSDVYETAMCFTLSRVAIQTLLNPTKRRPFVITPKGQQVEGDRLRLNPIITPHLVLFGLLACGLVIGLWSLTQRAPQPGEWLSLLWATINLVLLATAIAAANERPQRQHYLRIPRTIPCEVVTGGATLTGESNDVSERGIRVRLSKPVFTDASFVTVKVGPEGQPPLAVKGRIIWQERSDSGVVHVGIQFVELEAATKDALLRLVFAPPGIWQDRVTASPDMLESLGAVFRGMAAAFAPLRPNRRQMVRVSSVHTCQLYHGAMVHEGVTKDIGFTGVSVWFTGEHCQPDEMALLTIGQITLNVRAIRSVNRSKRTLTSFRVDSVERGEQQWSNLHAGWSQRSS
jgi:cellulose synthase (UDP-forming)